MECIFNDLRRIRAIIRQICSLLTAHYVDRLTERSDRGANQLRDWTGKRNETKRGLSS